MNLVSVLTHTNFVQWTFNRAPLNSGKLVFTLDCLKKNRLSESALKTPALLIAIILTLLKKMTASRGNHSPVDATDGN